MASRPHAQTRSPPPLSGPKHGKEDPHNTPHVGGNTWAGGTGGSDTAGLGGRGGPYRLDKGHDVHQLPDDVKNELSDELRAQARAMAEAGLQERLRDIDLSPGQHLAYQSVVQAVRPHINQLADVFSHLDATSSERVWLTHQAAGDLDDQRIVDAVAGDHNIFRRRADADAADVRALVVFLKEKEGCTGLCRTVWCKRSTASCSCYGFHVHIVYQCVSV